MKNIIILAFLYGLVITPSSTVPSSTASDRPIFNTCGIIHWEKESYNLFVFELCMTENVFFTKLPSSERHYKETDDTDNISDKIVDTDEETVDTTDDEEDDENDKDYESSDEDLSSSDLQSSNDEESSDDNSLRYGHSSSFLHSRNPKRSSKQKKVARRSLSDKKPSSRRYSKPAEKTRRLSNKRDKISLKGSSNVPRIVSGGYFLTEGGRFMSWKDEHGEFWTAAPTGSGFIKKRPRNTDAIGVFRDSSSAMTSYQVFMSDGKILISQKNKSRLFPIIAKVGSGLIDTIKGIFSSEENDESDYESYV